MTYLLDTNVFSEAQRASGYPKVKAWLASKSGDEPCISALVDGLMAATAKVHSLVFVTRNTRDVAQAGVRLFDPWAALD